MGELICTILGLFFLFGSFSIFMSMITDKHYQQPVKHSAIDDDLEDLTDAMDVVIMDEFLEEGDA